MQAREFLQWEQRLPGPCHRFEAVSHSTDALPLKDAWPGKELRAPVGDDAVLDGVLKREDAALGLRLVAHVRILLAHAHHHTLAPATRPDNSPHMLLRSCAVGHISYKLIALALEEHPGHS